MIRRDTYEEKIQTNSFHKEVKDFFIVQFFTKFNLITVAIVTFYENPKF